MDKAEGTWLLLASNINERHALRVVVATRIHLPEPSAASFRLRAVEDALIERGCEVTVLTATYPLIEPDDDQVEVKRWPVLRDASGYVRGYLPYLSFDVPLFFRLLLGRRPDVALVEPPPTTGAVMRIASALRSFPYVWYAADIWSDAAQIAGAPTPVVTALRSVERFAIKGAAGIIAVSQGVADRVSELGGKNVRVIPNGIQTEVYHPKVPPLSSEELRELGILGPYMVYAGTASEWQGASVFVDALEQVLTDNPEAQLVYVGQGSQWEDIRQAAARLRESQGRDVVVLLDQSAPELVARLLVGAELALVSMVPDRGYDFAYPTKVLAGLASGTPILYAGKGPVVDDLVADQLGYAVPYDSDAVADGMRVALAEGKARFAPDRLHAWVGTNRSMKATGAAAADFVIGVAEAGGKSDQIVIGDRMDTAKSASTVNRRDVRDPVGAGEAMSKGGPSVAVVTPWYPSPAQRASGLFVEREVEAMHSAGMDVRVVYLDRTLPSGKQIRELRNGVQVLRIGMNPANPASVARAVRPLSAALRAVDVVNSHAISSLPVVAAARGAQVAGRFPWVHTEHWSALAAPDSARPLLKAVRSAFASLLRLPDVVVAESERLAAPIRDFRGDEDDPSRPVSLIPCIVPAPEHLRSTDPEGEVLRLASTGGVIDRKNPILAVKTLASLRDRGVEASLRWTGDGDLREQAQELANELGVQATFLGPGTPEDVEKEIADAHIFFAPTKGDNFFVAAAEALVNGRPLCASDQGGHTEYADPRYSEIVEAQGLADSDAPDAYADALIRLRDKTRNVNAQEISESVAEKFSPAAVAKMYDQLYRGLTERA